MSFKIGSTRVREPVTYEDGCQDGKEGGPGTTHDRESHETVKEFCSAYKCAESGHK